MNQNQLDRKEIDVLVSLTRLCVEIWATFHKEDVQAREI